MPSKTRYPVINPRLGTLYAIFTSALISSVVLFIIGERLGMGRFWLSHIVAMIPLSFAAVFGFMTMTNRVEDFFVVGRRVPSSFNGFVLTISSLGGTGLLALTGLFLLIGVDAVALLLGWCFGFFFMAMLFAPYFRRMGAYTIPGFFAGRFASRPLGTLTAFLILPPVFLSLIAELKIGADAAILVTGLPQEIVLTGLTALILISILPGGMRSVTWSACAHFIVLLIGFLVPLIIISIYLTNLPLPQITYGTLLDDIVRLELINGILETPSGPISTSINGSAPQPIDRLFLQNFGALSKTDFYFLFFCILLGTATFPTLLIRASTAPTLHDARRSAGWALALVTLLLISAPAYAVFVKFLTLQNLVGATVDQLPSWAINLIDLELLEIKDDDQNTRLGLNELYVPRDGVVFMLPIIAKLPFALIAMTVTAALSAAIASASTHIVQIANSLSCDVIRYTATGTAPDNGLILTARIAMLIIAAAGAWAAFTFSVDPFWLIAWALSISASTLVAPIVFAIFWQRFSTLAALASMCVGFVASVSYIWFTPVGSDGLIDGISHLVAGIIGVPASMITALGVTFIRSETTDKQQRKSVNNLRSPNNQPIFAPKLHASQHQKLRQF